MTTKKIREAATTVKMTPGIRYIVTKKSKDGTFLVGDKITLLDDGCIMCAGGWIDAGDVAEAVIGIKAKPDKAWITKKRADIQGVLGVLNSQLQRLDEAWLELQQATTASTTSEDSNGST